MMFVVMICTVAQERQSYRRGQIYEVPAVLGREWIAKGMAAISFTPPPHVARLLMRLDYGEGHPCLFLPFLGEFGHLIMSHIRLVHFHRGARKVVCCRPGEEVLFPSADEFVTDWADPVKDIDRVSTMRDQSFDWPELCARFPDHAPIHAGNLEPDQEIWPIESAQRIPFAPEPRGFDADVVLGVRHREFAPERNWPHWQRVADAITAAGYTFAVIGNKETSRDLAGQVCHSGDFDTAAAVELLRNCKLYIGQDSGNSHLAAAVGARMLVFRETSSGSRDLVDGYMKRINPGRIEKMISGWDFPARIAIRACEILATDEQARNFELQTTRESHA